jgi:hypothetical protein
MQREATPKEARQAMLKSPATILAEFKSPLGTWKYEVPRDLFIGCMAWATRITEAVAVVPKSDRIHDMRYGVWGTDVRVEEYQGEEFAIFTINVLKRRINTTKDVALPLNHDPYARHLLALFKKVGDAPVFNFSRQYAWKAARIIFDGLLYDVQPYTVNRVDVAGHKKNAANHFLRHMRLTELGGPPFNFTGEELGKYVKWTASQYGVSPQVERYVKSDWRDYAAKLLVKKK